MADGYISQIKTPDNKVYLLKDSAKTDEKVAQIGNNEDKDFPVLIKNTNNTTNETSSIKYSNNITDNVKTSKPFTYNPSTAILHVPKIQISTQDDTYGLFPQANNWNQIGASNLYWYRSYIYNYYGGRSHVDNWDSGKNIGTAASASAAAVLGTVNFYNTAAAGATQTKTLLTADSTANSNITITLPKTTGTLALKSELPTLSGLGGIGTISASGTAPLTLSGSKSGTTYTLTGSIADASASASGVVNTDAQTFSGVKTFDNGLHIYGTISTQGTGSVAGTMYPGGAYHSGHNSIVLHGDTAGVSGIGFTSEKATKSGTTTNINGSSDRAFIQYHAYGVTPAAEGTAPTLATSGELGTLVIGVGNDATDTIRLQAPGTAGILHQIGATAYPIPHTTNTNGSVGGTTTPVYVEAGVIKALSYTIAKSVPSDAVFTDHYAWNDITGKPSTFSPSAHDHNRLSGLGRKTAVDTIAYNPSVDNGCRLSWLIYDSSSRNNDATNSPSFDASVINLPWDWGGFNGQIAISSTAASNTRMQIRSSSSVDNGENANPRYTTNYGAWREVVTATKATKVGDTNKPVYIDATGQATAISYTIEKSVPSNAVFTDHYAWGDITGKPTKITLTGAVTGNVSLGAGELTLSTSVNHNHNSSYLTAVGYDTTNKKIYYTKNGSNTDIVTIATLRTDMGLSNALHFIGITSTTLTDGSTTATLTAKSTNSLSKTTGFVDGDVVMDGDQLREYVWSGSAWRLLGITTSTAYTQPASTATNTWIAQISQGTDGKITATTGSLNTSGTWSGNAGTASKLLGFSASGTSNASWGNQTGTQVCWANDSSGGSYSFRRDNPSSGKLSLEVDGRFYGNEGNNPAMLMSDPNNTSYWGMGSPDGANNVWIRTTSLGIIPFQSGEASAGHGGIGTSSWYFASSYIQNMYGTHTGNVVTSSITHRDGGNIDNGSWITGSTGTAPTATTTDGTTTYSGAVVGTSILTLGNNKVGANSASGVANNAQGILRLYSTGSAYGELTGYTTSAGTHIHASTGLSIPENKLGIMFRPGSGSYYTYFAYQTAGNEALVAATQNAVTSFIFVNGESYANAATSNRWYSLTPGLQIKQNCVSIGELIPTGTNATYKLNVNGISNFKGNMTSTGNFYTSGRHISLISGGETDQFIDFAYAADPTVSTAPGASWRIGALNSGSGDSNYFVIQTGGSATNATTWNNALRLGMNTYDAGFGGNVYPLTNNNKTLGTSSLKWNNVYATTFTGNATSADKATNDSDGNKISTTYVKLSGGTMTGRLNAQKGFSNLLTGTGTAGVNNSGTYTPVKWTFNAGVTVADGDRFTVKIPNITNADWGVFMSVNNGTNYYPVGLNGTGRLTTHYPANTYIDLVFEASGQVNSVFPLAGGTARVNVTGGCWRVLNYYVDGNPGDWNVRQYTLKAQTAITAGHIIGGTDSGYNHVDTTAFDIRYAVLYAGSNINAGSGGSNNFVHHYAINIKNSSNSYVTWTQYKNLYIKGTLSGTTFTPITGGSPFVQDITTSDDGYVYYYIGRAYDSTNAMTFDSAAKKIYWYKDGAIREYGSGSGIKNITRSGTTFTATRDDGTNFTFTQQDNNTTYTFAEGSTNGAFSVTPSGGSAQSVPIHGLGTAAYKAVGDFAAASHSHSYLANTNTGAADRPIYITGNAAAQTTYRMAGTNVTATTALAITNDLDTGIWYVNGTSGILSQSDGAAYVNKYSNSWLHEIYGDYRTGHIAVRGKNNGTWKDWLKVLDSGNYTDYTVTKTGTGASGTWGISITGSSASCTGNAATATKFKDNAGNTTKVFYRGDNTWSNILKQTAASALGIDTNHKIGTAIKDLHFTVGSGSGTGINDGNAGGITIGTDTASYGGIYWQSSGSYGLRLHFATTGSFANGAYTRMLITHDGKVGIGTLTPDTLLTVNGNAKADKFIGALQGNADTATSAGKWTTARTLTIGNKGQSVDGSGNVSWSLADIGAATSGHNHSGTYVPNTTGANDVNTIYNTGIYNITSGSLTNGPTGYGYGQLLVMSYRKHTGNITTDWATQIYAHLGSGNNGNTLYYRTSNASTWQTWQMAAHTDAGTAKGGAKKPIYINAKGEIQEGDALKNLAYKDSLTYSDVGAAAAEHGTHVTTATVQSALGISSSGSGSKALTEKGTFVTFGTSNLTIGTTSSTAMAGNTTVTNVAISADTTTNKNYALVFGTTPSDGTSPTAAKTEGLQKNSAKFYVNPSTGNIQATTFNGYTLAAASAKGVITTIDTSANLPTSNAVKTFVEGKGYTTNTGTVTSVKLIQGAGITVSSSGTAITTTGERTISITGMDTTNGSTTKWLNQKGGWSTPTAANVGALASSTVVTNVAISANTVTNADYPIVFATSNTGTTAAKNEGLQKSGAKLFVNPSTGTLYSTKFCVDESVTLQYNTTDQSLDFIF